MTYASTPTTTAVPLAEPLYGASIGEAVRRFWAKYATFSGRASRSEYWWWALVAAVVGLVLDIVNVVTVAVGSHASGPSAGSVVVLVVLSLWGLATIVPTIALTARRLHDANFSAWMIFLGLIPFVGGLILLILAILPSNAAGQRFDK